MDQLAPIVIAYGDANALRRGVAHGILRDLMLHGPLVPAEGSGAAPSADDVDAWVDAYADLRAAWLSAAFGVPVEDARTSVAGPLHAVISAAREGRPVELVTDEGECVDCALARMLVGEVARATGGVLVGDDVTHVPWSTVESWRGERTGDVPSRLRRAVESAAATADGTVADAVESGMAALPGLGLSDMGASWEIGRLLADRSARVRIVGDVTPAQLTTACARGDLATIGLEPATR